VGSLLNDIVTLLIILTSIARGESGYHAYLQWVTQAGGPLEIPFRLSTLFLGAEKVYGRLPLKRYTLSHEWSYYSTNLTRSQQQAMYILICM
jgi:hypothetical protein